MSVERALATRRSVRAYQSRDLTLEEVSQLLWAAQGLTHAMGYRTAPSAGALYPLELYVLAGRVSALQAGVYKYAPRGHRLSCVAEGDARAQLCEAALRQQCVATAPLSVVFASVHERVMVRYGQRGLGYVYMEVGHAAQNLCLQAVALGLGTVVIGAFGDQEVARILHCESDERPLYLVAIGPT